MGPRPTLRKDGMAYAHKKAATMRAATCEVCAAMVDLVAHHIDGNPLNNERANLMTLCQSCHMKWHRAHGKQKAIPKTICPVCGSPGRRQGMCEKHRERWSKYGDPRLKKVCQQGGVMALIKVDD